MLNHTIIETSPQMFKKVSTFVTPELSGSKAIRAENVHTSTVQFEDLMFDANEDSMDRISRHIQLANYKYNRLCSMGTSPEESYLKAYVENLVSWKLADNSVTSISVEILCKVQELAVAQMTNTWI